MDGARFANAVAALGCTPGRDDLARRRRCAVLRRHQERRAGGRGGDLLRSGEGRRFRLPAQARRASLLQDALPLGAARRLSRRRSVAAQRARTPIAWRRAWPTAWRALAGARLRHPVEANELFVELPETAIGALAAAASASIAGTASRRAACASSRPSTAGSRMPTPSSRWRAGTPPGVSASSPPAGATSVNALLTEPCVTSAERGDFCRAVVAQRRTAFLDDG